MNVIADNLTGAHPHAPEDAALERRILRGMFAAVALAAAVSALVAPWRVTTGLLLGGALSIFNHHWLRTSIAAALRVTESQPRPRMKLARYVLRYFIVNREET
ncbi:MAG: ATP synthase subunit I [Acidobacteria bacterium]|nr:ATP synthase subunit I [Acidobacteriota bacterium]